MPRALTNDEINRRLHDYARDNYLFLGNVTKGVALAIATSILLQILSDFQSEWIRITPWLTSFVGILITYMTWGIGSLLSNSRANIRDSLLPLLMGMAEFLLFGILLKYDKNDHPLLWLNWFGCLGLHAFIGVMIIHNRIKVTDFANDFEDSALSNIYESWLRRNRIGASCVSIAAFIVWGFLRCWALRPDRIHTCELIQFGLAIPFMIALAIVISDVNRFKHESDEHASRKQVRP
ncbi:MAG TPA: hypothetical protein VG649_21590 [Candidatus Angelobacter sp.]|jgi:hypothetical protein|nr:hypothetical protein [Candidatus Angelobacter sp.]